MTHAQISAILPIAVLLVAPLIVMLTIAVRRRHSACLWVSTGLLVVAFVFVWRASDVVPMPITSLVLIDRVALFYIALTIMITLAIAIVGVPYLAREEAQPEEYYILLLLAAAGAAVMAASTHFASFYLGLEIVSVSQYGLVGYVRWDRRGTEASLKYVVLAAASAAFLLFGMALVYAELGTMQFDALAKATPDQTNNKVVLLGVAMMLASIGFKLSIVPFHLWTPDVYEGAPTPVTAFLSTVSKLGVLAVLVRYFAVDDARVSESLYLFVAITAAASMIVGNLLALIQNNLKRLLAYSSIAHMGYLSIAFLAGGNAASDTVAVYMVGYSVATLGAFGVIMQVQPHVHGKYGMERINDYRGLYWSQPYAGVVLAISLLSLMGVPMTAGFLGKLYVVLAGAANGHWWLLVLLALSSILSVYYYLRVIVLVFTCPEAGLPHEFPRRLTPFATGILLAIAASSIAIGLYPAPLLSLVRVILPLL